MKSDVLQQALDPNARRDVKGAEALAYTPTADRLPRRCSEAARADAKAASST